MDPRNHLICRPSLRHLKMLPKANTPALLLDFESVGVCCYDHHLTRKFYMDFGVEMFNKVTLQGHPTAILGKISVRKTI